MDAPRLTFALSASLPAFGAAGLLEDWVVAFGTAGSPGPLPPPRRLLPAPGVLFPPPSMVLDPPKSEVDVGAVVEAGAAEDDDGPTLVGELTGAIPRLPKRFDAPEIVPPGTAGVEDCAVEEAGRLKVTPDVLEGRLLLVPPGANGLVDCGGNVLRGF